MAKKTTAKKTAKKPEDLPASKVEETSVSSPSSINFAEDAGLGQEEMSKDDYTIPRLAILQALSEKITEGTLEGAKAGMVTDNVEDMLIDGAEGLVVVPISYSRSNIEWRPRKEGGGIETVHDTDYDFKANCTQDEKGKWVVNGSKNTVVPTAEYFLFVVDPETGAYAPYALAMHGSQLKKARRWNTMINQYKVPHPSGKGVFNPAMFYRSYKLQTIPESNSEGSWFGWNITGAEDVIDLPDGEMIYLAARDFRESVASGKVKAAAHEQESDSDVQASEDTPM